MAGPLRHFFQGPPATLCEEGPDAHKLISEAGLEAIETPAQWGQWKFSETQFCTRGKPFTGPLQAKTDVDACANEGASVALAIPARSTADVR